MIKTLDNLKEIAIQVGTGAEVILPYVLPSVIDSEFVTEEGGIVYDKDAKEVDHTIISYAGVLFYFQKWINLKDRSDIKTTPTEIISLYSKKQLTFTLKGEILVTPTALKQLEEKL